MVQPNHIGRGVAPIDDAAQVRGGVEAGALLDAQRRQAQAAQGAQGLRVKNIASAGDNFSAHIDPADGAHPVEIGEIGVHARCAKAVEAVWRQERGREEFIANRAPRHVGGVVGAPAIVHDVRARRIAQQEDSGAIGQHSAVSAAGTGQHQDAARIEGVDRQVPHLPVLLAVGIDRQREAAHQAEIADVELADKPARLAGIQARAVIGKRQARGHGGQLDAAQRRQRVGIDFENLPAAGLGGDVDAVQRRRIDRVAVPQGKGFHLGRTGKRRLR